MKNIQETKKKRSSIEIFQKIAEQIQELQSLASDGVADRTVYDKISILIPEIRKNFGNLSKLTYTAKKEFRHYADNFLSKIYDFSIAVTDVNAVFRSESMRQVADNLLREMLVEYLGRAKDFYAKIKKQVSNSDGLSEEAFQLEKGQSVIVDKSTINLEKLIPLLPKQAPEDNPHLTFKKYLDLFKNFSLLTIATTSEQIDKAKKLLTQFQEAVKICWGNEIYYYTVLTSHFYQAETMLAEREYHIIEREKKINLHKTLSGDLKIPQPPVRTGAQPTITTKPPAQQPDIERASTTKQVESDNKIRPDKTSKNTTIASSSATSKSQPQLGPLPSERAKQTSQTTKPSKNSQKKKKAKERRKKQLAQRKQDAGKAKIVDPNTKAITQKLTASSSEKSQSEKKSAIDISHSTVATTSLPTSISTNKEENELSQPIAVVSEQSEYKIPFRAPPGIPFPPHLNPKNFINTHDQVAALPKDTDNKHESDEDGELLTEENLLRENEEQQLFIGEDWHRYEPESYEQIMYHPQFYPHFQIHISLLFPIIHNLFIYRRTHPLRRQL